MHTHERRLLSSLTPHQRLAACIVAAQHVGQRARHLFQSVIDLLTKTLERQSVLVRDPEHDYLQLDALDEESACMDSLRGHCIAYRIAMGRHAGKKAFTLQTLPATDAHGEERLAKANGFSLHAESGIGLRSVMRFRLH